MLIEILSIIAPVFVCAVIGYGWVRQGHSFDTTFVSRLVTNVGAPCLLFATFMDIELDMDAFATMLGAAFISTTLFGLTALPVLYFFRLDPRAFLPSQMFPNVGNMGLPLCLFAFGEEGLALALTFFTISMVFGFTVGMTISAGKLSIREIFRTPVFYSVIITMTFVFAELPAPAWLLNTTRLLGGLTIPMMLIALGVSLAQFTIAGLKRSIALSVLRMGVGFIVAVSLAELLQLEGAARGVLILQCSMPVAVFAYLFAVRYNRQPVDVAGTVVVSTLLSFLSLPLLLWYVLP